MEDPGLRCPCWRLRCLAGHRQRPMMALPTAKLNKLCRCDNIRARHNPLTLQFCSALDVINDFVSSHGSLVGKCILLSGEALSVIQQQGRVAAINEAVVKVEAKKRSCHAVLLGHCAAYGAVHHRGEARAAFVVETCTQSLSICIAQGCNKKKTEDLKTYYTTLWSRTFNHPATCDSNCH